jgi:hypothetical protein
MHGRKHNFNNENGKLKINLHSSGLNKTKWLVEHEEGIQIAGCKQ